MATEHVCIRCGICCTDITKKDHWLKAGNDLDTAELKVLARIKDTLPEIGDYCDMLIYVYDQPTCLIEMVFGKEKKPHMCKEFPGGQQCCKERLESVKRMKKYV